MITVDRGFIQILGPDFGFWLFGSSDRGSQRFRGNLTFSFLCANVTQWRKWLEMVTHLCVTGPWWWIRIQLIFWADRRIQPLILADRRIFIPLFSPLLSRAVETSKLEDRVKYGRIRLNPTFMTPHCTLFYTLPDEVTSVPQLNLVMLPLHFYRWYMTASGEDCTLARAFMPRTTISTSG